MNTTYKIIIGAVIGLLIGAGGALAFSGASDKDASVQGMTMQHSMQNGSIMAGSSTMQNSMDNMMSGLHGKTGDAFDQEFLSEMITHHQGAVSMAQAAIQSAKHPEIKQLAQDIITAQDKEISEMKSWQASWYGNASSTGMQMSQ